jgi:hypothetical protein
MSRSDFARKLYGEERVTFLPRHPTAGELIHPLEDATATPRLRSGS